MQTHSIELRPRRADENEEPEQKAQHQRGPARGQAEGDPQRIRDQHADQRARVHPRQIFYAAVGADLIADRPNDVITAENDKVENECQQQRVDLVRLYINDFRKNAFQ